MKKINENKVLTLDKEQSLIRDVFFFFLYYFQYLFSLIFNYKNEFICNYKNYKNNELKLQITYMFFGILTLNILIFVLEEYQVFSFNLHNIVNDIQMIFVYFSASLYFLLFPLLLSVFVKYKSKENINNLIGSTMTVSIKIFNLIYPSAILFFAFILDTVLSKLVIDDFNMSRDILSNNDFRIPVSLMAIVFLWSIVKMSSNLLKDTLNYSRLRAIVISIVIYIFSMIIFNLVITNLTLNPVLKHVINVENMCQQLTFKKLIKNSLDENNYNKVLKECVINLSKKENN